MARSIHSTRRSLREELQFDYADSDRKVHRFLAIARDLSRKHRIKKQVRDQRREVAVDGPVPLENVVITVRDAGEYVHFPASPDDIRAVLRGLPSGSCDGLHSITLCLGATRQASRDGATRDPLVQREGFEYLPKVYAGQTFGICFKKPARIEIYGYVYEPDIPDREMWEVLLRLQMLSTLVHEIAHHQDFSTRMGRGRWYAQNQDRLENYAESTACGWFEEVVVPYVQKAHPRAVASLGHWLERSAGAAVPLPVLLQTRTLGAENEELPHDSVLSLIGDLAHAIVEGGDDLIETQLAFSFLLESAGRLSEAMRVVEHVLSGSPRNRAAITEKASLLIDQGRLDEAESLARQVVAEDPRAATAWSVLTSIALAKRQWTRVHEMASWGLAAGDEDLADCFVFVDALSDLMLHRFPEIERNIELLRRSESQHFRRSAEALNAAALLLQMRYADARLAAKNVISGREAWGTSTFCRALLLAVQARAGQLLNEPDTEVEAALHSAMKALPSDCQTDHLTLVIQRVLTAHP